MLNKQDTIDAANLAYELRGWAKARPASPMTDCLNEAADIIDKFLSERQAMEQFIEEREWLHREG
jgi:hypothetical protein